MVRERKRNDSQAICSAVNALGACILGPFHEQGRDEVLGVARDGGERVVVEVVVARRDVRERVGVVVPHERRQPRQPVTRRVVIAVFSTLARTYST